MKTHVFPKFRLYTIHYILFWFFLSLTIYLKYFPCQGFPGGAVVKNPPASEGDMGSSSGLGRSHMPQSNEACAPQLLSLHSRAHEPQLLSPHATTTEAHMPGTCDLQQEKPLQWEACTPQQRVALARRN